MIQDVIAIEYLHRYRLCQEYRITPAQLDKEYVDEMEIFNSIKEIYASNKDNKFNN